MTSKQRLQGRNCGNDKRGVEGKGVHRGVRTFRPIDFDFLVKDIFLLDERFTHCMSTKLEQRGMSTHLMTIRLQRHRLRRIQRCKLISTLRLVTPHRALGHCTQRRRGCELALTLTLGSDGGGRFICVGCCCCDGGGSDEGVFPLGDEGVLTGEFRVICRCCFCRFFRFRGLCFSCCGRDGTLFCRRDKRRGLFGGDIIVGAGSRGFGRVEDGWCCGGLLSRGRGRWSWRFRGFGDAFEDS